jgi:hypothetical protein
MRAGGRANAPTHAAIGRRRPILLQPTPGLLGDSDCGRGAFERVILRRSQFESGTSCHGNAVFLHFFALGRRSHTRSWECSLPSPQMKSASPKNTLRFDEHSYGHNGSVNAAVWSADDTDRVSNAKCYLLVSRHGRACPGSCRTKSTGAHHSFRLRLSGQSLSWGALTSSGIKCAPVQLLPQHFSPLHCCGSAKPSFKRRDGFL